MMRLGPSWVLGPDDEEAEMAKIKLTDKTLKFLPNPSTKRRRTSGTTRCAGFGVVVGRDG